jgi:hypothetical protein
VGAGKGTAMNDPDQERTHLAQADHHIDECKGQIARLEKIIQRQTRRGESIEWAQHMLEALQSSLRAFEKYRRDIISHKAKFNVDDPAHWRDRAEEARSHAEQMGDETSRQTMLRIADDYERLAKHAERRAKHRSDD